MISKVVTLPAIHFLFINTYILIYSNYSKSAICILQPFFSFSIASDITKIFKRH